MPRKKANLSTTHALQHGWEATSKYIGFYITFVLLIVLFSMLPPVFSAFFDNSIYTPVIQGIYIVLIAILTLGIIRTTLRSIDKKEEPTIKELFRLHMFFRYLGAALLYLFMFIGGLFLFIVPGIYWGLKYQFATYLVIDKKLGIMESFEESAKLVEGYEWDLFGYWLVMFLLNLVGLLFFVVGLVITLPVTLAGYTYLYRQLRKA